MKTVTTKQLEAVVERINHATKSPLTSYTKDKTGKFTANIGNYHLSWAYGGVTLHRMHNTSGGIEDVFNCGHVSKRELLSQLFAFIAGMDVKS